MDVAKVMIVEDDVIVAEDLSRALRASGYDVPGYAMSGDEALDLARAVTPDLILMDVFLSDGHDGITVARTITDCRSTGASVICSVPSTPIIALRIDSSQPPTVATMMVSAGRIACWTTSTRKRRLNAGSR